MADTNLTRFVVDVSASDALLQDFQDPLKRLAMLESAKLSTAATDALSNRLPTRTFELSGNNEAGTGFGRTNDANRLAKRARALRRTKQ
jgi:hypothetical protein